MDESSSPGRNSVNSLAQPSQRDQPRRRVLVVGHVAGDQLFGAERSLLDLLDGFAAIGIETEVLVPPTNNQAYVEEVARRTTALHTVPRREWWPLPPSDDAEIQAIADLVRLHSFDAVHVNTIVPQEALIAARRCGVPAVLHARELPHGDPDLWKGLGAESADALVESSLAAADYVVACSRAVAATFGLTNATAVVPNIVDIDRFADISRPACDQLRVALVGSTTERKGLLEFVAIARLLESRGDVRCVVVGPLSPLVLRLLEEGDLPANLDFVGYAPDPPAAMAYADVVVNLSVCREASGRTVLEAMASALPVVAGAQGGIPESVTDGVTGFLVPPGDRHLAAQRIAQLADDAALRARMGIAGREFVRVHHSLEALASGLESAYRAILPSASAREQAAADIVIPLTSQNRTTHAEPYFAGNRARFATCTSVRFVGADRLVVASLLAQEMHLVHLDVAHGTGTIETSIRTTNGERDVSVDLIDFDGNDRLIAANCEHSSVSTYRVEGAALSFVRTQLVDEAGMAYCHGTAFVAGRPGVVAAALTTDLPRVEFLTGGGPAISPFVQEGWLPKSVTFVGPLMIVASVRRNNTLSPQLQLVAQVALVALAADGEHQLLDVLECQGIFDGCHASGNMAYFANQSQDSVVVVEVKAGALHRHPDLEGFSLPHDTAVSPDGCWLAVANYGGSAVRVRRLADPSAVSRPDERRSFLHRLLPSRRSRQGARHRQPARDR